LADLEARVALCVSLSESVAELEEAVAARSPLSEVDRLNLSFEKVAELEEAVAARSPLSEVDRLNLLFDDFLALERTVSALSELVDGWMSERAVEIPWVARSYQDEGTVVEVGYAFAEPRYLIALRSLEIPDLILLDVNEDIHRIEMCGGRSVVADVRNAPFDDGSVDLVLCISTIEHIGRANDAYGTMGEVSSTRADIDALIEMSRWLRPGGRVLLSVPFGKLEDHGWLTNYDDERLSSLVQASGLSIVSEQYLELAGGWVDRDRREIAKRGYRSFGAPHAGAVALLELVKQGDS
jgi:O-antigen chain-terminating methyltransferase